MARQPGFKGQAPSAERTPRVAATPTADKTPVWRIGRIDFGGPWCPKTMDTVALSVVMERLKELETMTWPAIESGTGSHFVAVQRLIPQAQKRLVTLKLDDFEELFSLRITGKPRLWGLRTNNVFSVLWWDPDHSVCPSVKKHT